MNLIKNCPSCGKKLRFPIDKGKIRISCACGHSFIADPDDPALFKGSSFDLGRRQKSRKDGIIDRMLGALDSFDLRKARETVIRSLYDFKYRIQNFRLLPTSEKIKLLAIIAAIIAAVTIVLFAMSLFHGPEPLPPIDDNVI